MGRKRKVIPFKQDDFFGLVDIVTLGTKPFYVEQIDDEWPPYAEITSSRVITRQPRPLGRRGEKKPEFLSDRFPQHEYQKFCSGCAEWVDRWKFGEDTRHRDGLQSWCYECEAARMRRHRWAMKYAVKSAA